MKSWLDKQVPSFGVKYLPNPFRVISPVLTLVALCYANFKCTFHISLNIHMYLCGDRTKYIPYHYIKFQLIGHV